MPPDAFVEALGGSLNLLPQERSVAAHGTVVSVRRCSPVVLRARGRHRLATKKQPGRVPGGVTL